MGYEVVIMGAYLNFCKTKDEDEFQKFCQDIEGLIINKLLVFKIRRIDFEDAKQEIYAKLFQAADNYNPEIKTEVSFAAMIIERALWLFIKTQNRQKHKFLNEAASLDKQIFVETGKGIQEYYEIIPDFYNLEDEVITKEKIKEYCNLISSHLTDMERRVWKADIITRAPNYSNIQEIVKMTGYDVKKVDNALGRIRLKIKQIKEECD